jgi:hypothetical protein
MAMVRIALRASVKPFEQPGDTRIFSPLAIPGLCVPIGRYVYVFKRLAAVFGVRFYRFEHIVSYSSSKVIAKWPESVRHHSRCQGLTLSCRGRSENGL